MDTHIAQLALVEALRAATDRGLVSWASVPDDDRDTWVAEIGGEVVRVEFVSFPVAVGGSSKNVLATLSGMKTQFQMTAGTPAFQILRDMLKPQQLRENEFKGLTKATAQLRRLIEDLP